MKYPCKKVKNTKQKYWGISKSSFQYNNILNISRFICIAGKQWCIVPVSVSSCLLTIGEHSEAAQGNAVVYAWIFW